MRLRCQDSRSRAPQQRQAHWQLADTVGLLIPLEHSGSEATGIHAYHWDVYRGNAEVWQGRAASETRLKALAKPPRVLHLATPGFYLPQHVAQAERPLTLSGLALAGANQGMQGQVNAAGDDGILYALEVQHLNLQGTELVALSACRTGQGAIDYTEGIYGLVRAFRVAGARRVLMTLTNVDDADAERFMLRFYANWLTSSENPNRDPGLALQQTRLAFLHDPDPDLHAPRFWTPYVLVETRVAR
ncbi:MAG: CHAT domain-containing protein [Candidatus Tectimicrobiota bacterium]